MDPKATNLFQPPLPAVLPLHHEIDTVRQCGQNARCGGLECNGLALEVYAIDSFGSQGLEHCTKEEDADENKCSLYCKEQCSPLYSHEWLSKPK